MIEQDVCGYGSPYESAEAVENKDGCGVHFSRGGLDKEFLNDGFGFLLKTDIEKGESFLDVRCDVFLAHVFVGKMDR